jgi:hypothetical protein
MPNLYKTVFKQQNIRMPSPQTTPTRTHTPGVKTPGAPKKKRRGQSVRRRFLFPEGDMSELEI